jgi:hypothetical protein
MPELKNKQILSEEVIRPIADGQGARTFKDMAIVAEAEAFRRNLVATESQIALTKPTAEEE